ncbi:MAG: hypothetical protein GF375_04915 [Candidatus Omnitrophica bacterium]|nr:hypothetical protein [Candidatus Omnitrophota bacterium]
MMNDDDVRALVQGSLIEMAPELQYDGQFKLAASLIATIPPDFFMAQADSIAELQEEADEEDAVKLQDLIDVYKAAIPLSMKYRKVMRHAEVGLRKAKKEEEVKTPEKKEPGPPEEAPDKKPE